jgi:hypothetical protein
MKKQKCMHIREWYNVVKGIRGVGGGYVSYQFIFFLRIFFICVCGEVKFFMEKK